MAFISTIIIFRPAQRIGMSMERKWIFRGLILCYTLLLLNSAPIMAQVVEEDPTPRVYVDCNRCDYDHIRREIPFVDYVREPAQADIHLFITDQETGDGGREYEFSFIGRREFSSMDFEFEQTVGRNATQSETREEINNVIRMGLFPYMLRSTGSAGFSLSYEIGDEALSAGSTVEDPWRYWVFEIYAGSLSLELESSQTEFDSRWGFYANKVTEEWKIQFRPYFNYSYDEIERSGEDPIDSRRHRHGIESYAIRSINNHWSAGLFADYLTRNDQNIRHQIQLHPGIEYSLLPYDVATRKAITFSYRIGYSYLDYYDETIFNKFEEQLFNHQLAASVGIEQPWGSISSGLVGSHYFHDFEKSRAEFFGNISIRVFEGLSVNAGLSLEMIRDQLSLRLGNASLEDVLLRQQEVSTDFEFSGFIALSYTFGSDFANIVNTRF
jgi:hypothetical protein